MEQLIPESEAIDLAAGQAPLGPGGTETEWAEQPGRDSIEPNVLVLHPL